MSKDKQRSSDSSPSHSAYNAAKRWDINKRKRIAKDEQRKAACAERGKRPKAKAPVPKAKPTHRTTALQNIEVATKLLYSLRQFERKQGSAGHLGAKIITGAASRGLL